LSLFSPNKIILFAVCSTTTYNTYIFIIFISVGVAAATGAEAAEANSVLTAATAAASRTISVEHAHPAAFAVC
jgi:hypothetical protein